jgi:hypothetical protein
MDFVNEEGFACLAKLNPASTMTVCLPVPMCYKCLSHGHFLYDCTNDWVCKACHKTGHKMVDCPNKLTEDECETQDRNTEDSNTDVQTDTVRQVELEVYDFLLSV